MKCVLAALVGLVILLLSNGTIACDNSSADLLEESNNLKNVLKTKKYLHDQGDLKEFLLEAIHDLVNNQRDLHNIIRWFQEDLNDKDGISKSCTLIKELFEKNTEYSKELIAYIDSHKSPEREQLVICMRARVLEIPGERKRAEQIKGQQRKNDPGWISGTHGAILMMSDKDAASLFGK